LLKNNKPMTSPRSLQDVQDEAQIAQEQYAAWCANEMRILMDREALDAHWGEDRELKEEG